MLCEDIVNNTLDSRDKNLSSINEVGSNKLSPTPETKGMVKETISSKKCWNCGKDAKYKCPNCLIRTCSVSCVKLHKQKYDCDGRRCKTTYKPKENLNENDFLSDYRFLEEVDRCACKLDRNKIRWRDSYGMNLQRNKAASMKINLKLLPQSFSRRKENTTFYCFRLLDKIPLHKAVQQFVDVSAKSESYTPSLYDYVDKELLFYMKKEDSPANEISSFGQNSRSSDEAFATSSNDKE